MPPTPPRPFFPYQRSSPTPTSLRPTWLLALALLPILLLGLYAWSSANASFARLQEENNAQGAQLTARNFEQFLTEQARAATGLSRLPLFNHMVATHDLAKVRERLKVIVDSNSYVERAFLTDHAGKLWCDYPFEAESQGRDYHERDWFQQVLAKEKAGLSGVYLRLSPPHHETVSLAIPFRVNNAMASVLVYQYSLPKLCELLATQVDAQGRSLLLLDPVTGLGIYPKHPEASPALGALAKLPQASQALAGNGSSLLMPDPFTGDPVLASFVPARLLGHDYLAVSILPAARATQARQRLAWQLGTMALLLGVISAGALRQLYLAHRSTVSQNETLEAQNEELQSLAEEMEDINSELSQENEARRSAESDLLGMQSRLQALVEKGARELALKEQQFMQAQKLESVGRLAGGVAHDFNNLLTVILGYSEMQLAVLPPDSPLRPGADEIRNASLRGSRLTSQLLTFARRQVLRTEPVQVDALVHGLHGMMGPLLGEDVRLKLNLAAPGRRVLVDPGQLEQALVNLLVNARDAMPDGGVIAVSSAVVELDEGRVQGPGWVLGMGPVRPGPYVSLSVRDNGQGIPPEVLRSIFEPFFTTKAQGKGTGLGLSMVHGAIRAAEGQLQVLSVEGEGSEFILYLPELDGPPAAAAPPPDEAAPVQAHATLLLVDDDIALRSLCGQILKNMGFKMHLAGSGDEALALARGLDQPIDLLLTDLVMPGMSGIVLAETLLAERPGLKVIFMTGYTVANLPDPQGMDYDFLQKPFTPSDLRQKIRAHLDGQA